MKTCNVCHETRLDADMATRHGALRNFCKACHAARQRGRPRIIDRRTGRVTTRQINRMLANVPAINPAPLRYAA